MTRSGYSDELDNWQLIRWRGAVNSAIKGRRGQAMLQEIIQALDALPEKELATNALITTDGQYCTLGALGRFRGMDMDSIDTDDRYQIANAFGCAEALAAEIMFLNDEYYLEPETPNTKKKRWKFMRDWVSQQIIEDTNK